MSIEVMRKKVKSARSPELVRLIRALEIVASDLPRIMRKEKEVAFASFDRVDLFEAHMREMRAIPAHLEALARVVDRSLQVDGSVAHLSRTFQALNNMRPVPVPDWEGPTPDPAEAGMSDQSGQGAGPVAETGSATDPLPAPRVRTDPGTGDVRPDAGREATFHPADLNLEKVRDAIVPGGEVCGRSMYQSSRARLVTARAAGKGPWRFQFRAGSLEWAAEAEERGLRGLAALICGDLGYVQVPARLLLERGRDHIMRSSGGNRVLRPGVAVFGGEAILHPGAMSRTRPGQATKLTFVEF